MLIVTAPLWFKAPFKFLRLFVREKLRERVRLWGADGCIRFPFEIWLFEGGGCHELVYFTQQHPCGFVGTASD